MKMDDNSSSSSNNHNRRNDDETIKAILSRLSNNDKIVEEVRQLVAENLQLKGSRSSSSNNTKNNDTLVMAAAPSSLSKTRSNSSAAGSKEVTINDDDGTDKNNNATRVQTPPSSNRQSKSKTTNNDKESSEELAFTIDKDSETYHNILSMAKWYRDSFFIGLEYANVNQQLQQQQHHQQQGVTNNQSPRQKEDEDQRKRVSLLQQHQDYEKRQQHQLLNNNNNTTPLRRYRPQITSYTPTPPLTSPHNATGYPILSTLFENYIQSSYAYNTVHPYATWITSHTGPLYPIASTSLSQSIPLGQSLLNWTCRENVLWLLQDEEWRDWGKSITRGYIIDSDVVSDSGGGGGSSNEGLR